MAKASVSRQWFIAVDGEKEILRQKWMEYKPPSGEVKRLFVVAHSGSTGENPHVHVLLEETDQVQKQSLDKRLQKYFEVENFDKKRGYCSKVWDGIADGEGAGSYCFHEEGAEIIINMGISDEDILIMRKANAAVQKVVAMNKERASGKLVERALKKFGTGTLPEMYEEINWLKLKAEILQFMIEECQSGKSYFPGWSRMRMFVDEVELRLMKDDKNRTKKLANRMAEQFWGQRV